MILFFTWVCHIPVVNATAWHTPSTLPSDAHQNALFSHHLTTSPGGPSPPTYIDCIKDQSLKIKPVTAITHASHCISSSWVLISSIVNKLNRMWSHIFLKKVFTYQTSIFKIYYRSTDSRDHFGLWINQSDRCKQINTALPQVHNPDGCTTFPVLTMRGQREMKELITCF